jgi:hypothetical protein
MKYFVLKNDEGRILSFLTIFRFPMRVKRCLNYAYYLIAIKFLFLKLTFQLDRGRKLVNSTGKTRMRGKESSGVVC